MKKQVLFHLLILLIAFLMFVPAGRGQDSFSASDPVVSSKPVTLLGKVIDAGTQLPLEYAAVSLFAKADSSLVNGIITDESGRFSLEAPPGHYYLRVEFLGYQPKTVDDVVLTADQPEQDLGVISVEPEATVLSEVVVEAEASQVQLSLDKKVYNVGKDLSSMGGTATDILDNVPSVQVDVEGNVSLRGSENVRILVDGKPSGLIGISTASGLRQLPANLIDRVEVITNPSARYEAEGTAGIINIVLKKEERIGINGSFDLTAGYPHNYMGAVNLNLRTPKLNLFTNTGLSYRRSPGTGSLYQEVYNGDTTLITKQSESGDRGGWSGNIRLGADYFFNPKNILTTAFTFRTGKDIDKGTIEYYDFLNSLENPTAISRRFEEETEDELNLEYSATYRRTFEREGQELTADVRYQDNTEDEHADLREEFFDPEWTPSGDQDLFQRSQNKESERILITQIDYVHPFGQEGKFEAGWRSSFRNINNDFLVEELADGNWESLPGLSNNFRYQENIYAAYLIYGDKRGRFSYQLGLRPELSNVVTELLQTAEVNERTYLNLFPSAHLTYDLPADNAVQVSYSRRLRRPRFRDLNPFFSFNDNRNYFSGNPDLDPEFTHSIEVGHLKYWTKGSLSSAVYYRHTDGEIQRIRRVMEDGTSITRPENLATQDAFGIDVAGSFEPLPWWRFDANGNFFRSIINGENVDSTLSRDTYSWFMRGTSRITLWKKADIQLRFNYRAPQETTQGRRKSMLSVDLGASMDVFDDKATLTLSIRDLFNTRRYRYIAEGDNFYSEGDFQRRPRQIRLTLNYRLNQQGQRGRQRDGGRDDNDMDDMEQF